MNSPNFVFWNNMMSDSFCSTEDLRKCADRMLAHIGSAIQEYDKELKSLYDTGSLYSIPSLYKGDALRNNLEKEIEPVLEVLNTIQSNYNCSKILSESIDLQLQAYASKNMILKDALGSAKSD